MQWGEGNLYLVCDIGRVEPDPPDSGTRQDGYFQALEIPYTRRSGIRLGQAPTGTRRVFLRLKLL